jgi:beta-glucosidase
VPQIETQLLRPLERDARRTSRRPLCLLSKPATASPIRPKTAYRFIARRQGLSEGSLRKAHRSLAMGNFKAAPGASPSAPPVMNGGTPVPSIPLTSPTPIRTNSSSSTATPAINPAAALPSSGQAPAQAQLDEAVAAAKQADVVVAFVGLSPQLEGEEMPIKIDGFSGGDRTSLDLPAPSRSCWKPWPQPASH